MLVPPCREKTYPDCGKLILPFKQRFYLLHPKFWLMTMFDRKLTTPHYSTEASELNKLIIKLKREVLKGSITAFSMEEIDDATIPALNVLRNQKFRNWGPVLKNPCKNTRVTFTREFLKLQAPKLAAHCFLFVTELLW